MKRIAAFTLLVLAVFCVGVWSGRAFVSILPTHAQMQAELKQAQRHMEEVNKHFLWNLVVDPSTSSR